MYVEYGTWTGALMMLRAWPGDEAIGKSEYVHKATCSVFYHVSQF